ncbi:MAG: hypothetical protein Q8M92_07030, partial [Candidatus Subteraquimicrobiales bacterium]|nr:hypothetical protein [Candidatus Subteraquimicrobiales bacterium]
FEGYNWPINATFDNDQVVSDLKAGQGIALKGNGLGILSVIRAYIARLKLNDGIYSLEKILTQAKDHTVVITAGGQAQRNAKYTQIGKCLALTPIISKTANTASPIMESLLDLAVNMEANYKDSFMFTVIYGDALMTFNPEELASYYTTNPEIKDGLACLLLKMSYKEATKYGMAMQKGINVVKIQETYSTAEEEEIKKEIGNQGLSNDELMKAWLKTRGYLVEDDSILMNPAFSVLGIKAFIAYAYLAGIVNKEGMVEVKEGKVQYQQGNYLDKALNGEIGKEVDIDYFGKIVPAFAQEAKSETIADLLKDYRGLLYALPVKGVWYDTGAILQERDTSLQKETYQEIAETYQLQETIASAVKVEGEVVKSYAYNSYVEAEQGDIHPKTLITNTFIKAGEIILEEGSQIYNVLLNNIKYLRLYKEYVLNEGAVKIDGKDFAAFLIWEQVIDDVKENFYGNRPLTSNLFKSKIFPVISIQQLAGNEPIDKLDAQLYQQLPEILEYLQQKIKSPPSSYKEALK